MHLYKAAPPSLLPLGVKTCQACYTANTEETPFRLRKQGLLAMCWPFDPTRNILCLYSHFRERPLRVGSNGQPSAFKHGGSRVTLLCPQWPHSFNTSISCLSSDPWNSNTHRCTLKSESSEEKKQVTCTVSYSESFREQLKFCQKQPAPVHLENRT